MFDVTPLAAQTAESLANFRQSLSTKALKLAHWVLGALFYPCPDFSYYTNLPYRVFRLMVFSDPDLTHISQMS